MTKPVNVIRDVLVAILLVMGVPCALAPFALGSFALAAESDASKPLDAAAAREKVGEKVKVQVLIRAAKDRLEKRGEIYLDSELDFRDPKNFAIVITRDGARSLKEKGVEDIVGHFQDKTVVVEGTVSVKDETPRMEVDDAERIRVVENP